MGLDITINNVLDMSSFATDSGVSLRKNFKLLNGIRLLLFIVHLLLLYLVAQTPHLKQSLPFLTLLGFVILFAVVTLVSIWRSTQQWPISTPEFAFHLMFDVVWLSFVTYFSGGVSNPFVAYYLVPICIAATTLRASYTWALTIFCVLAYAVLLFQYVPVPFLQHFGHDNLGVSLHHIGMWLNFSLSALIIGFFVARMTLTLREHQESIVNARERQLEDAQVFAMASMAASTAHELGTPLNSMNLLVDDCEQHLQQSSSTGIVDENLTMMREQIYRCRQSLHKLSKIADCETVVNDAPITIENWSKQLIEHWLILRPNVALESDYEGHKDIVFAPSPTLSSAMHNLLNNAADASPERLQVRFQWRTNTLNVVIRDYGAGISSELAEQLGKNFISSKTGGLGIGYFLAMTALERLGGEVALLPANKGDIGSLTRVVLPLTHMRG